MERRNCFMKEKKDFIKVIGLVATVISIGANLVSEWVDEKKMDEKIEEKVNEALALRSKNDEKES
jgi:hypothetical protein